MEDKPTIDDILPEGANSAFAKCLISTPLLVLGGFVTGAAATKLCDSETASTVTKVLATGGIATTLIGIKLAFAGVKEYVTLAYQQYQTIRDNNYDTYNNQSR